MAMSIIVGEFHAVVTSARVREFDSKDGKKHFKMLEVGFFSDEKRLSGVITDWSNRIPAELLAYGTLINVKYDKCAPMNGAIGFYEFRGEVDIIPVKK